MSPTSRTNKIIQLFLAATLTVSSGCAYSLVPHPHQHRDLNQDGKCDICGSPTYAQSGYGGHTSGYYYGGRSYGSSGTTATSSSPTTPANGVSQGTKGGIGSSGHSAAS